MKTVFEINTCNIGSTGNIMLQIAAKAREDGFRVFCCCPDSRTNRKKKDECTIFIGTRLSHYIHDLFACYTGIAGLFSIYSTCKLVRLMKKEKCSLIHLHNLHGNYINYPILFAYIKKNKIPLVWTLHDCWSFTGRCPYFDMVNCDKWKTGCYGCIYPKSSYPQSMLDNTRLMWLAKRRLFTNAQNCTIVTPSEWLSSQVGKSYLKDYPTEVIYNGVDLDVFYPMESDLKKFFKGKHIVLGVAFEWERRKGLDVFIELAKQLTDDYKIVLVGTDDRVDQLLPSNVISIHKTQNQKELAQLYSVADVFVNPTREEVFGLVNVESLACGTPVITFDTGGSPECIDSSCGIVVERNDVEELKKAVEHICLQHPFSKEDCINRARFFDKTSQYCKYVDLYKKMTERIL